MNKSTFQTIVLLCGLSTPVMAQEYAIFLIPPDLLTNANAVIRHHECTFKITDEDEAEMTSEYAVTILNKEAEHLAWLVESESSFEKIKYITGQVFDAAGQMVRESKKSDLKDYGSPEDYEFSDAKYRTLDLRYGQYPYTVVFQKKYRIKGFFRIPSFEIADLGQSVQHATFTLQVPPNYAFRWKGIRTDVQPTQATVQSDTAWSWVFEELPAMPSEVYPPFLGNTYAALIIAPNYVKIDDYKGGFENWEQIGLFFNSMNKGLDQLSPAMKSQVTALTQGATSTRDKIGILYHYLQENHRYISIQIGIGGWRPLSAQFVEQKRYGDCKALSNYMKALLQAAGIPAQLALIFAGHNGAVPLYDEAPSPAFNHMILYVPNEDIWLECTSNNDPMGYLSNFTANRKALLLTPTGGKIVHTPALQAAENVESNHITIVLSADGGAEIKTQMRATGDRHDIYRNWSTQKNKTELEKAFTEDVGIVIQKINALTIVADKNKPEARIQYDISVAKYASRTGKRLFVPLLGIHHFRRALPTNANRTLDLSIPTVYTFLDTVTVQFPAGFSLENTAADKKVSSEFGSYEWQVTKAVDHITIVRRLELLPIEVPAARYQEVRQFYLDIARLDNAQAVLVGSQ